MPSTSGTAGPHGMESWGWGHQVSHWTVEEVKLLKRSWRESTLVTYKRPIQRWIDWCVEQGIDPRAPDGNSVARFLAKLYLNDKLAYNTILLHKSAISTYCATSNESFSKNFFVQQILKAISLARPHVQKPPVFDIKLLFDWLQERTSLNTLFDVSRRTALILLLASGRRIHDLTLLDISGEHYSEQHDRIVLHPRFGSKTDTSTHRQSDWVLLTHDNDMICPVKHIRQLIQLTNSRRLVENNITSLFVTIKGAVRPASRTIIGGWIKSIFKDINISAPPGIIRSAVASRGWFENHPVEEILKRGNWKSFHTFRKFYCRKIESADRHTSADLLFDNFSSV